MRTFVFERVLLLKSPIRGGCDQSVGRHLVGKPNAKAAEILLGRPMSRYEKLVTSFMILASLVLTNRVTTGLKALMTALIDTWQKTFFADEMEPVHQKPAYRSGAFVQ